MHEKENFVSKTYNLTIFRIINQTERNPSILRVTKLYNFFH